MIRYKVSGYVGGHGYFEFIFSNEEAAQKKFDYYNAWVNEGFVWDLKFQKYWEN